MTQNSATTLVTVFSPDGQAERVTRLNAIDLTRYNGYRWNSEPASEPAQDGPSDDEIVEENKDDEPVEQPDEEPAKTLDDEAKTVADYDSVEDYLNTFDQAALRTLLEERFGEKVHPRTGKEKLIDKYIELNDLLDADEEDEDED